MLNNLTGEIVEVLQDGKKFKFRDFNSGEIRTFLTQAVVANVRSVR